MSAASCRALAYAKLNLALVVGPPRPDRLHPVATLLQRIDLADRLEVRPADTLEVDGFPEDTLVRSALAALAEAAGVEPAWRVTLEKAIPVAAGLGGGSADAACALALANRLLPRPLLRSALHGIAARLGADVPFFLEPGPKLAEGTGERLRAVRLPQDYAIVVAIAAGASKRSTRDVYRRFDELGKAAGFEARRSQLLGALKRCHRARDLGALPANDLRDAAGATDLPERLLESGAFRADVTGAGPAVYGLFTSRAEAESAAAALPAGTRSWVASPVW